MAHRGWSAGEGENTLAAFQRAAAERRIDGVEFDVRRCRAGRLVVSHDPPGDPDEALPLGSALEFLVSTDLELLVELKEPATGVEALGMIDEAGLGDRSLVFGFPDAVRDLPWHEARAARLGVIVQYPWQLRRLGRANRPDVILLGWDERAWTRMAFKSWWSVFSLSALARQWSATVIVGIVQRERDIRWLNRQGIEAAVVDLDAAAVLLG